MSEAPRVFQLRTYHAVPGKLEALVARFRDHTMSLFDKHGLTVIGFWLPLDTSGTAADTLVYVLSFVDRDAARQAWRDLLADPAWLKAEAESELDGPLIANVESVFLTPSDFSPLR